MKRNSFSVNNKIITQNIFIEIKNKKFLFINKNFIFLIINKKNIKVNKWGPNSSIKNISKKKPNKKVVK